MASEDASTVAADGGASKSPTTPDPTFVPGPICNRVDVAALGKIFEAGADWHVSQELRPGQIYEVIKGEPSTKQASNSWSCLMHSAQPNIDFTPYVLKQAFTKKSFQSDVVDKFDENQQKRAPADRANCASSSPSGFGRYTAMRSCFHGGNFEYGFVNIYGLYGSDVLVCQGFANADKIGDPKGAMVALQPRVIAACKSTLDSMAQ